jgi:hypothetical protein
VDMRELGLLVISAKLFLQPDYVAGARWENVVSGVRARLLEAFSFDRRDLAQDAVLSVAVAAMQAVPGVDYVDVDAFGAIPEKTTDATGRATRPLTPDEIVARVQSIIGANVSPAGDMLLRLNLARLRQLQGRVRVRPAYAQPNGLIRPAQLVYLSPRVPDTLILNRG